MALGKRGRDRLYIIAEILAIAKDGSPKTRIMYRANLSFNLTNFYLPFLLKTGLLRKVTKKGKTTYKTTSKGMKFLELYKEVLELLPKVESLLEV